jgi:hypothetical protein
MDHVLNLLKREIVIEKSEVRLFQLELSQTRVSQYLYLQDKTA